MQLKHNIRTGNKNLPFKTKTNNKNLKFLVNFYLVTKILECFCFDHSIMNNNNKNFVHTAIYYYIKKIIF